MESIKSLTFYDKLLSAQYYKASQKFSKEKDLLSVTYMKMHFRPRRSRFTRRKNFDLVFRNLSEREGLVQSVKSTMGD